MTKVHGEYISWILGDTTTGTSKVSVIFMGLSSVTNFQDELHSTSNRGKLSMRQTKGDYYLVNLVVQRDLQ